MITKTEYECNFTDTDNFNNLISSCLPNKGLDEINSRLKELEKDKKRLLDNQETINIKLDKKKDFLFYDDKYRMNSTLLFMLNQNQLKYYNDNLAEFATSKFKNRDNIWITGEELRKNKVSEDLAIITGVMKNSNGFKDIFEKLFFGEYKEILRLSCIYGWDPVEELKKFRFVDENIESDEERKLLNIKQKLSKLVDGMEAVYTNRTQLDDFIKTLSGTEYKDWFFTANNEENKKTEKIMKKILEQMKKILSNDQY